MNIQNVAGDTPLHIAARREMTADGKSLLVLDLFDAGADPFIENLKRERASQLLGQADGIVKTTTFTVDQQLKHQFQ